MFTTESHPWEYFFVWMWACFVFVVVTDFIVKSWLLPVAHTWRIFVGSR